MSVNPGGGVCVHTCSSSCLFWVGAFMPVSGF